MSYYVLPRVNNKEAKRLSNRVYGAVVNSSESHALGTSNLTNEIVADEGVND